MKRFVCFCVAAIVPAFAQEVGVSVAAEPAVMKSDVVMLSQVVPGLPPAAGVRTVEFIGAEMAGSLQPIKNAPYAADTVTESTQALTDGNRIVHKSTQSFYRDSEGRTRREMNIEIPGNSSENHKLIMIDDPVAGVHYSLNSREKVAHKMPALRMDAAVPKMAMETSAVSGRAFRKSGVMGGNVAYAAAGTAAFTARLGAPENATTQDLGTQVMEGLNVKGTKTSFTIPAGEIGNEKPIVSTTETWYSDELKTTILSKRSDPRFGETTTRTTNIRRSEPGRELFEAPADYKVVEPEMHLMTEPVKTVKD